MLCRDGGENAELTVNMILAGPQGMSILLLEGVPRLSGYLVGGRRVIRRNVRYFMMGGEQQLSAVDI